MERVVLAMEWGMNMKAELVDLNIGIEDIGW